MHFCSQAKLWPPLNGHFFKVKILGKNPTRKSSEEDSEDSNGSKIIILASILAELCFNKFKYIFWQKLCYFWPKLWKCQDQTLIFAIVCNIINHNYSAITYLRTHP